MQYMLMFYETPADIANRAGATAETHLAAWMAYIGGLYQSGVAKGGEGLMPPASGTSLRIRGDQRTVQDGPFAETKEQLGGFMLIDVPHLDAALEWAARAPCAGTGGVEVRPLMPRAAS